MKILKILLGVILGIFSIGRVSSQTPTDSAALRALQVGRIMPQEQVYMQFDNTAYFLGDTLWFKASVTSNNDDRPTELSRVLYVELTAPEGYVIKTEKYKLDDAGTCVGEFYLDPLYYSGYFEVRAYTRYMLNRGEHAHFSRVFPVFDKVNNGDWTFRNMLLRERRYRDKNKVWFYEDNKKCELNFYPEGGHLVSGITSRVAYEILGVRGVEVNETVTLLADGKEFMKSSPVHMGKGSFTFTPQAGVKYLAEVFIKNNKGKRKKHRFKLPAVEKQGVVVSLSESKDSVNIVIRNNYPAGTELGFVVLHRSSLGFYRKIIDSNTRFAIHKNDIYEGVCRAVVFSGTTPLAERLFFVEHDSLQAYDRKTVKLKVKADNMNLHKFVPKAHEKVSLCIEQEDSRPIDKSAEFTVSVMDQAGKVQTSWGYNMYSYMLLGSELRGYIPDAGQYFDRSNRNRKEHLDLVMLTNGWTAYDWSLLTAVELSDFAEPEKGITLRGKFYLRTKNRNFGHLNEVILREQPFTKIRMDFVDDNNITNCRVIRTNDNGFLNITLTDFYGRKIVALSPETKFKQSDRINYIFSLDRYFSPTTRLLQYREKTLGSSLQMEDNKQRELLKTLGNNEYLMQEIEINGKKKKNIYNSPPMSELRLNYLEEWEYANDVTFLQIDVGEYKYEERRFDELMKVVNDDISSVQKYQSIDSLRLHSSEKTDPRREALYQYRYTIRPQDVLYSIQERYSLVTNMMWYQLAVVDGEYNKDSVPLIDHKYLHHINVEKMLNFKEIIITGDYKKRKSVTGGTGEDIVVTYERVMSNKGNYSIFYEDFISLGRYSLKTANSIYTFMNLPYLNNYFKQMSPHTRVSPFTRSSSFGLYNFESPDYMVYYIPYNSKDSTNNIIPDLSIPSSTCRYTSVQGYSESKQFYSPDYSRVAPAEKDYRRTLLWNPRVKPTNGKLLVEFYNSSECDAIAVNVEGRCGDTFYSNDETMQTRVEKEGAAMRVNNLKMRSMEMLKDSLFWAQCDDEFKAAEVYHEQKRYSKGLTTYIELTQYGYPAAIYRIGEYYRDGHALKINKQQAFNFMLKAAKKNYAPAQHDVAVMYREGVGTERDLPAATHWFEKAVEQEYAASELELGKTYFLNGDSIEGEALVRKSAVHKNAEALFVYSRYMQARGIEKDSLIGTPHEAVKVAAEMGYNDAMLYMMRYEDSCTNYKEAYHWAIKLRTNKVAEGIVYLADCYHYGRGIKKNKRLAKDLYSDAAKAGNKDAKRILEEW